MTEELDIRQKCFFSAEILQENSILTVACERFIPVGITANVQRLGAIGITVSIEG